MREIGAHFQEAVLQALVGGARCRRRSYAVIAVSEQPDWLKILRDQYRDNTGRRERESMREKRKEKNEERGERKENKKL